MITMNALSRRTSEVQMTLEGRKATEDWNFAKADTSYFTHGVHEYPARMIPQIAQRLILSYSEEKDTILDPFCGSGTTLVECRLSSRNAFATDTNSLAVLLAKVKSTPIDFSQISFNPGEFLNEIEAQYLDAKKKKELPNPPLEILPNLLHWFKEPVTRDLEFLYKHIVKVKDSSIRDFLKVVFSKTVFTTSNIDRRSSRFIRILHKNELARFNPNVLSQFRDELIDSVTRMSAYVSRLRQMADSFGLTKAITEVHEEDARALPFSDNSFDAVVTSPPYGEEKNTVGYVRWSKLSVAWLRMNSSKLKANEARALGTNSRNIQSLDELPSETARHLLRRILKRDPARARDAIPFFFDYLKTMHEMHRVLKDNVACCIVIGDRSIRKMPLDMEKVTVELAKAAGFSHEVSYFREIPMKLIPWTTPTGRTISRESIIILRKS